MKTGLLTACSLRSSACAQNALSAQKRIETFASGSLNRNFSYNSNINLTKKHNFFGTAFTSCNLT